MNYVIIGSIIFFLIYLGRKLSEASAKISTEELAKAIFDQYMRSGNPITIEEATAIAKQYINVALSSTEKRVMVYADLIMQEGYNQGMDPAAIAAVIAIESEGNPYAKRNEYDSNGILWATSYGLMQILDTTADWLKKREPSLKYNGVDSLYIPGVNIEMGTYYLKWQFTRYNRLKYAFAGYNAGTCMVLELGKVRECYTGAWGPLVNSAGETNVSDYVMKVLVVLNRYRMIFAVKYPEYTSMFPSGSYLI